MNRINGMPSFDVQKLDSVKIGAYFIKGRTLYIRTNLIKTRGEILCLSGDMNSVRDDTKVICINADTGRAVELNLDDAICAVDVSIDVESE